MKVKDHVKKCIDEDIDYWKGKIAEAEKNRKIFEVVGEVLDENGISADFFGSRFTITPSDENESFRFTGKLLKLFPQIAKFEKEFDGSYATPMWKWVGCFYEDGCEVRFVVVKATPSKDCTPRPVVSSYTSWTCRKGD